eukprot:gene39614-629_t
MAEEVAVVAPALGRGWGVAADPAGVRLCVGCDDGWAMYLLRSLWLLRFQGEELCDPQQTLADVGIGSEAFVDLPPDPVEEGQLGCNPVAAVGGERMTAPVVSPPAPAAAAAPPPMPTPSPPAPAPLPPTAEPEAEAPPPPAQPPAAPSTACNEPAGGPAVRGVARAADAPAAADRFARQLTERLLAALRDGCARTARAPRARPLLSPLPEPSPRASAWPTNMTPSCGDGDAWGGDWAALHARLAALRDHIDRLASAGFRPPPACPLSPPPVSPPRLPPPQFTHAELSLLRGVRRAEMARPECAGNELPTRGAPAEGGSGAELPEAELMEAEGGGDESPRADGAPMELGLTLRAAPEAAPRPEVGERKKRAPSAVGRPPRPRCIAGAAHRFSVPVRAPRARCALPAPRRGALSPARPWPRPHERRGRPPHTRTREQP